MIIKLSYPLFFVLFFSMSGCNSSKNKPEQQDKIADYELLFIGNSHSSVNDLPGLVATLIETGLPSKSVNTENAAGWGFLADRVNDGVTLEKIQSKNWTYVILQAQKYSSSGLYSYPTDAAESWIIVIKDQNAIPVLFPEWPRRGNFEEGQRVHDLHLYIASQEPACVAPIGLVWDEVRIRYPEINLHAQDGNHSNLTGALLTAYVFYQVFTGKQSSELPYINQIAVTDVIQQQLREVASEVVNENLCD